MKALAVRWGLENGEAGRVCREVFGLAALRVQPIGAVGRRIGFALLGEFLLAVAPKGTKKSCPSIWVPLRETSLIPSPLRGPAYKGHPWPFTPRAASMPLAPLRADSIRPSERGVSGRLAVRAMEKQEVVSSQRYLINGRQKFVGWKSARHFPPQAAQRLVSNVARKNWWVSFALPTLRSERGVRCRLPSPARSNQRNALDLSLLEKLQATRSGFPFRRPSTGVAQGGSRHGCRERSDGTWMSLRDDPRSNAGARGVLRSKTRMQGWPSFWLLFLGHTRKSDAPCKAQPVGGAEESATPPYLRPSQNGSYKTPRVMVPQC
jgi:hypothetical protein